MLTTLEAEPMPNDGFATMAKVGLPNSPIPGIGQRRNENYYGYAGRRFSMLACGGGVA